MGSVYAVASGKGGVGKTTTALNLGVVLAQAGREVAVVDTDLAMANLSERLGLDADGPSVHDVLADEATVREAVVEGPDGLAVLPGNPALDAFADADPTAVAQVCRLLAVAYDVVLVDTGAGVQRSNFVAFRAADAVLVVTKPDETAIADANRTVHLAARADCPTLGTVVTCADRTDPPRIVDALAVDPLAVIPRHTVGGPVTARRPESAAADAYRDLAAGLPAVEGSLDGTDGTADEETDEETDEHEDAVAP